MKRFASGLLLVFLAVLYAGIVSAQSISPSPSTSPSNSPSTSPSTSPSVSPSPSSSPVVPANWTASPSPSLVPANSTASPTPSPVPSQSRSPSATPSNSAAPSVAPINDVDASFGSDPSVTLSGNTGRDDVSVSADFGSLGPAGGAALVVANTTRASRTVGGVETSIYNTTFEDSGATLQQTFEFSRESRRVTFANQTYSVPAGSSKFTVFLDQWPLGASSDPLVITNNVTVGAAVRSIRSTVSGAITVYTIITNTDLVVRVSAFTVAEYSEGEAVRTVIVTPTFTAGNKWVLFSYSFPAFSSGTLNYDPVIALATTSTGSSASTLTSFVAYAASLLF